MHPMVHSSTALTERVGVQEVGLIFTKRLKWFFREQAVSDFGVDAEVEIADAKAVPTGQLIALQIKSGTSFFQHKNADGYTFYGEPRHLEYWLRHSLPVFLIIHNPETGLTLWQRVERHLTRQTAKGWAIHIPAANVLDEKSKPALASGIGTDRASVKRYRFATDKEDMEKYRDKEVFFKFDFWVNKTLGLRKIDVYYGTYEKSEPDSQIGVWGTTHEPHDVMNHFFPWLTYRYAELIPAEEQSNEVETHIVQVELNEAAEQFLALEAFFEDPDDPKPPEEPERDEEDEYDEDDFNESAFRRAVERDRS
ncbi:DUF4365 domain-containing protein [Roseomonas aerophila]|uniref:DUF4365 domain-containing protein n=1 Tax=Teichococcus aerophilus TaxID=1224513 RepID=A0ABR7RLX8_9PROT|nr:DUF4365 domain-containing protein [Pseudoroseomonas aerophila]MBC9207112.1 DUF4365 domain-containing protein [Pseudoroseomonas aerophila]